MFIFFCVCCDLWIVLENDDKDWNRGASAAELLFARQSDPKTFMAFSYLIDQKFLFQLSDNMNVFI